MTELFHFTDKQDMWFDTARIYEQKPLNLKPTGLWLSDETADNGWFSWCTVNGFWIENLAYAYKINIDLTDGILMIETTDDLVEFINNYQLLFETEIPGLSKEKNESLQSLEAKYINWELVTKNFKGIFIRYHNIDWHWRFTSAHLWVSSWDCDSACIWDLSCINSIEISEFKK